MKPVLWTCLLGLLASSAVAQDDEDVRRHGIFVDSVEVSLVNVEVVAVDRDGRPVTDLRREDFEVLDDGEVVEVTHFYRVTGGLKQPPEEGEAPEPDVLATAPPSTVIVLVDQPFLSLASRQRIFKALDERIEALTAGGSRIMVIAKDREVRVEQPLTTDRAALREAMSRIASTAPMDTFSRGTTEILNAIARGADPRDDTRHVDYAKVDARSTMSTIRHRGREQVSEIKRSVGLLRGFVNALAGLPGRKAVLHVCDRLPARPSELEWSVWYEKYGTHYGTSLGVLSVVDEARKNDTRDMVRDLFADANASGVVFYPVGEGLDALRSATSAELRNASLSAAVFAEVDQGGGSLEELAVATGGAHSFGNRPPADLIERVRRDLADYYSLGYPSPHRGDGESHEVKVRFRKGRERDGIQLRHVTTYRDKDPDEEMRDLTLAALLFESVDNPLDAQIETGTMTRQADGNFKVRVALSFPMSRIALLPEDERHVGDVVLYVHVQASGGGLSEPVRIPVPLEIPNASILDALSRRALYQANLTMAPGEQTIAVGVRDVLGGQTSTARLRVDVRERP